MRTAKRDTIREFHIGEDMLANIEQTEDSIQFTRKHSLDPDIIKTNQETRLHWTIKWRTPNETLAQEGYFRSRHG